MVIDALTILLLPAILFIGAITTYEDIKIGKIRNKWVLFSLFYSLIVLLGVIVFLHMQNETINKGYISLYFLNIGFALFVGMFIWFCNLWSAGDAKLFMAYAALVPLSFYQYSSTNYFPSFAILAYTFVPFLIFYLFKILFKTNTKLKLNILKSMLNPKFLLNSIAFIFAFTWLGSILLLHINKYFVIANNVFIMILFLFFVVFLFNNILKINYSNISINLSLIAILFDYEMIFTLSFLKSFIIILFLFIFLRYFILNLAFEVFSYPIYIENLKPGMVIAENYLKEKGIYKKRRITPLSFMSSLMQRSEGKFLFNTFSEGLTKKDVDKIRELHSQDHIKEHTIRIFQTVPFAPFIFFGVILTLLFNGSIFLMF
jgi:hypothetical protein